MFVRRLFTAAVLVTAIASLPTTAAAQQIGVKAGVNFATLVCVSALMPKTGKGRASRSCAGTRLRGAC